MGTNKLLRLIGAGGATGLGILAFVLLSCPNLGSASAVGEYTGITNEADAMVKSNDTNALTKVWVKPTISIALGSTEIELDTAKSVNNFISGTANLKVSTNSTRGFKVLVNSIGSTNLVATDDSRNTIPTIYTKSTADNFPSTGGWGYYADATAPNAGSEYYPTSTSAVVVKETDTSTTINNYKVGIGVKIDPTTPIGNYQNQLVVSVVANPTAAINLAHITKMQEMTPEICAATPSYVDVNDYAWKTLIDDRIDNDGNKKSYKVAKLNDGNCWMVENLAYSLGKEMTSADTDLAMGTKVTLPATTTDTTQPDDYNGLQSRNPSNYPNYWYYKWDAATATSGRGITMDGQEAPDSICPKGWQMPLAGAKYNTITKIGNPDNQLGSGSFYDLFISHGITNYSTMTSIGVNAPLNFYPTGFIYSGGVARVGEGGDYWPRVAVSSTKAYRCSWWSSYASFNPSATDDRGGGFTVRCIARQVAR